MTIVDVTADWRDLMKDLPGSSPYHSGWWGETVAANFGGDFKVFRLQKAEREKPHYLPVLVGGELAGDGFCSGHIGYGGALTTGSLPSSLREHFDALHILEVFLGRLCCRISLGPAQVQAITARAGKSSEQETGRSTTMVDLTEDHHRTWDGYGQVARNTLRRCARRGLTAGPLTSGNIESAVSLIHDTQQRVGSTFRTPPGLIARCIESSEGIAIGIGCWAESELAAVGVFLKAGKVAELAFTGWRYDLAELGANYIVMDEGLRYCGSQGVCAMDLGYSHTEGILRFKQHWGGRLAPTAVFTGPDLDAQRLRFAGQNI